MGRVTPQAPPWPPDWTTAAPGRPLFPPNRAIVDGEPICELCGSGYRSHAEGAHASHQYQGRLPIFVRLRRFFGRLRPWQ